MKKTILLFAGLAFLTFKNQAQTVTDYDGNVYNTVTIGTQVWLKENLKVTHYRNGDLIPNVTDGMAWSNLTTGAYCNFNNDANNYSTIYGRLYNWYAVNDSRNIAPVGWHVPTHDEWTSLERAICTSGTCAAEFPYDNTTTGLRGTDEGGKLKEIGTTHWQNPNTGATNETGFLALPGDYRSGNGTYTTNDDIGRFGDWWEATENGATSAWYRYLSYNNANVGRNFDDKRDGLSVRCIRDSTTQINEINYQEEMKIYPNPATNNIIIESPYQATIEISNIQGHLLKSIAANENHTSIDISDIAKGMYFVKVKTKKEIAVKKFIKK